MDLSSEADSISFCVDQTDTLLNAFGDHLSCSVEKSGSLFSFSGVSDSRFLSLPLLVLRLLPWCVFFAPSSISLCVSALWFLCYARSAQLTNIRPPVGD